MLNINMLPGAASAASALTAEKVRMEVISQNIANAGTTQTPGGGPYQRQVVRFETILSSQFDSNRARRYACEWIAFGGHGGFTRVL